MGTALGYVVSAPMNRPSAILASETSGSAFKLIARHAPDLKTILEDLGLSGGQTTLVVG
jgi:hypothetical protein